MSYHKEFAMDVWSCSSPVMVCMFQNVGSREVVV